MRLVYLNGDLSCKISSFCLLFIAHVFFVIVITVAYLFTYVNTDLKSYKGNALFL